MTDEFTFSHFLAGRGINGFKHEPNYSFEEWAEKFLEFENARFRFRPYQRRPARDLFDSTIRQVAVRAYSGAGKTVLFAAAFGYAIDELNLKVGLMYPTQEDAKERLRDKFFPIFEKTPRLARMPMRKGLRGDLNLACDKHWARGGRLQAIGANSWGKIRNLEVDAAYVDETDAISHDTTDEGDKVAGLYKRTRGRQRQFHWATSYPSKKGFSKIDQLIEESDCCRWLYPCWHCSELFEGHTRMVSFPKGRPALAEMICPECGRAINDDQRRQMSEDGGRYIDKWGHDISDPNDVSPEFNGTRGYHVNCMAHVGQHADWASNYLEEIATELETIPSAENPRQAKRVFVNTMDAESYADEIEEKPDPDSIYELRENYSPYDELPDGVLALFAGCDWQKDRAEVEIVGFGLNSETWGCGYRVIEGSALRQQTWNRLWAYLATEFKHPTGHRLKVLACGMDSAYRQDEIFKQIRGRPNVYAMKGSSTLGVPIVSRPRRVGKPRTKQYQIGTHEAKDLIYQRGLLRRDDGEQEFPRGYQHFPAIPEYGPDAGGRETGYFEMLFAEDATEKRAPSSGELLPHFDNPHGMRNEALDIRVYAMAAEKIKRPNYMQLVRDIIETPADTVNNLPKASNSSNFATNW